MIIIQANRFNRPHSAALYKQAASIYGMLLIMSINRRGVVVMYRLLVRIILIGAILWGSLTLAGCAQSNSVKQRQTKSGISAKSRPTVMRYGPVYPVRKVKDPLVAKTIKGAAATGSPVVSAEIRGYLVDWVIRESSTSASITELAVMKDGSAYRIRQTRPSAAFGNMAPSRLTPEPAREAKARKAALAAVQKVVAKKNPKFASVKPIIYNYLVKIHHKDGSSVDVWVDPNVARGRFLYNVGLVKLQKVK